MGSMGLWKGTTVSILSFSEGGPNLCHPPWSVTLCFIYYAGGGRELSECSNGLSYSIILALLVKRTKQKNK